MAKGKWAPEKQVVNSDSQKRVSTIQIPGQDPLPPIASVGICTWSCRKVMTVLLFLGIFTIYAQRVNLSVAIVAMVNSTAVEGSKTFSANLSDFGDTCPKPVAINSNGTDVEQPSDGEFVWSETTQGLVLGAFLYGYIPTQVIGGRMAEVIGGKVTFALGLGISTLLSFLTPLAARSGVAALIALRAIVGIAQGVNVPTVYAMMSEWTLPEERTTLLALALAGGHIGNIFAMPISGLLCDSDFLEGWPAAFYVFGALGCVVTVLWILGSFDRPSQHPRISEAELHLLSQVQQSQRKEKVVVPWSRMLRSVPLWASCLAKMSLVYNYNMIFTKLPAYLEAVLHFPIKENGLINAIIFGALAISMVTSAKICDYVMAHTDLSKTTIRRIFQAISSFGMSACMFLLGLVGCNATGVVSLLAASMLFFGANAGGEQANCFDLAPKISGTISGLLNMMASLSGSMAPLIAGLLLEGKGNSLTNWSYVFYLSGGFGVLGGLAFVLFGSGEEQPWANSAIQETEEAQKTNTYRQQTGS